MATQSSNKIDDSLNDVWLDDDAAKKFVNAENATRPFGKIIAEKSGLATSDSDSYIFDLATGTGAMVQNVHDLVPKEKWGQIKILGGDINAGMLDYLKKRAEKQGWTGLETKIVDGNDFDLPAKTYTHVFNSFGLYAMPDALPKLYELLKPGGFIGITSWAQLPFYTLLARSIAQMKGNPPCPPAKDLHAKLLTGYAWDDKEYVKSQLSDAGFKQVDAVREQLTALCGTPAEYMETMDFLLNMVAGYWEEGKRDEWLSELKVVMRELLVENAGGEKGQVQIELDGNAAWGWKAT